MLTGTSTWISRASFHSEARSSSTHLEDEFGFANPADAVDEANRLAAQKFIGPLEVPRPRPTKLVVGLGKRDAGERVTSCCLTRGGLPMQEEPPTA